MSRVEAAAPDRLPWLPDDPQPPRSGRRGSRLLPFAGVALAILAGAGWLGLRNLPQQVPAPTRRVAPSTTVSLPAPRATEPAVQTPERSEVTPTPVRAVRSAPVREVRIVAPPKVAPAKSSPPQAEPAKAEAVTPPPVAVPKPVPLKPWNPRVAKGANGRLVQIGAFGSIHQAKQGWWYMALAYPGMRRLPAVVRPTRNSKGRVFYRFQVGTTSQAHSEVLCQRMEQIRFSCAVVGLPWKTKVER